MGSSSSIMQATLMAGGETQNSTITFHCQELRDTAEENNPPQQTNKKTGALSGDSLPTEHTVTPSHHTSSPCKKSLSEDEQSVTRYFPIIQPHVSNFLPAATMEILEQKIIPGFLEQSDKDRLTRENYYYSCDICSKGFMFKGSLNRHMARHVHNTGVEDISRTTPRQFPLHHKINMGVNEVRYQLKDPRLYEQQGKLEKLKTRPPNNTKTYPAASPRKAKQKCALCNDTGHNMNTCKTFPRSLVIGQKVLAICSCLKCNKSFNDVEKLKEHIPMCQGFRGNKQLVQSECNVR